MMAQLPKERLARGVICSSAGNHAQGVALAAKKLHCNAVIVMPVTTPEIKVASYISCYQTVSILTSTFFIPLGYTSFRVMSLYNVFVVFSGNL